MDRSATAHSPRRDPVPTLAIAAALLLGVGLLREAPPSIDASAVAAPPSSGLANPADQRNEMIAELRRITDRLDAIQKSLEKGPVPVRTVETAPVR